MKWVKDRTGRFVQRPHYLPSELDQECEAIITEFVRKRHHRVEYPILTDDITVLIESLTHDLDLYADLSSEDGDVEGVTNFFSGRRPTVRIAKHLSVDTRMSNRLRTTLTHELAHVKFHAFMFDGPRTASLFPTSSPTASNKCKRNNLLLASQSDWMEWQAGFACGAFLMPISTLKQTVQSFLESREIKGGSIAARSPAAEALIAKVSETYGVSRDAARVRLMQQQSLVASTTSSLF